MFLYTETVLCVTPCTDVLLKKHTSLLSEKDLINSLLINHITFGKNLPENILIFFLKLA